MTEEKIREFLEELRALSLKYGIALTGQTWVTPLDERCDPDSLRYEYKYPFLTGDISFFPAPVREITPGKEINIIRDVEPFRSPVDRSVIGSRSQLREHNKRHGVIQVGNELNNAVPRTPRDDA